MSTDQPTSPAPSGSGEGTSAPSMAQMNPITFPYYFGAPWLPTYSGEACHPEGSTFTEFKAKVISMFRLYALSDQQQVEILCGQLKGPALREVRSWPAEHKQNVEQVLKRLAATFEKTTLSALKMRFYACKQRPGESLRNYALTLQEALKSIEAVDPEEVRHREETLIAQLIEGVYGDATRTQLRMLRLQLPRHTFFDFKEAALTLLETTVEPRAEFPGITELPSQALHTYLAARVSHPTPLESSTVSQGSQIPSADPLQALKKQMEELMLGMVEMRRKMQTLSQAPMPNYGEPRWRNTRRRTDDWWEPPRGQGRRPTDRFDAHGRPICRRCQQTGHVERQCREDEPLNSYTPRVGAKPRGAQEE